MTGKVKNMKICIFGSASSSIDGSYIKAGEKTGEALALMGHHLVFGGGSEGMMGAFARGFKKGGGHITGVIPDFFRNGRFEQLYKECDEAIYTEDIAERLRLMENMSDAFVVMPGGAGTFEEFFKILVSISLDRHKKPLALVNINGYFDPLGAMLRHGADQHFISENCLGNFRIFNEDQIEEMEGFLKSNAS